MELLLLTKGKKNLPIRPGSSRDTTNSEAISLGFELEASPYQEKDNANMK